MSRTLGGNPLRNAAIRQGKDVSNWPASKPATRRPYTEADRARLLAPIRIEHFGGKSWGGALSDPSDRDTSKRYAGDRYGYATDWVDLDNFK
jgi:hypothetical protein